MDTCGAKTRLWSSTSMITEDKVIFNILHICTRLRVNISGFPVYFFRFGDHAISKKPFREWTVLINNNKIKFEHIQLKSNAVTHHEDHGRVKNRFCLVHLHNCTNETILWAAYFFYFRPKSSRFIFICSFDRSFALNLKIISCMGSDLIVHDLLWFIRF